MFLFFSKTLDWLLSPLSWALVLALVGLLIARWRPKLGAAFGALAFGLVLFFSLQPVADGLASYAEAGARPTVRDGETYDAVIVLGGALEADATERWGSPQYNEASERLMRGFELLQQGRARHALISGGTLDLDPKAPIEAAVLAGQLAKWGVARERLFVEGRSRNTRENAIESARIVHEQGWKRLVLVTSAAHMPRALGCFRAVGLEPDALPVDYRSVQKRGVSRAMPRVEFLDASSEVLRELAGRVTYRLFGYSK